HDLFRISASIQRTVVREYALQNCLSQELSVNRCRDSDTILGICQKASFDQYSRDVAVTQNYKPSTFNPSITASYARDQRCVHGGRQCYVFGVADVADARLQIRKRQVQAVGRWNPARRQAIG